MKRRVEPLRASFCLYGSFPTGLEEAGGSQELNLLPGATQAIDLDLYVPVVLTDSTMHSSFIHSSAKYLLLCVR